MTDQPPLVITGSLLQALSLGAGAVVLLVAFRDDVVGWAGPAALALSIAAAAIAWRRCELFTDRIRYRRLHRTIEARRGSFEADLGHRYLTIATAEARFRIEVPVEIRPNVRDWVIEVAGPGHVPGEHPA